MLRQLANGDRAGGTRSGSDRVSGAITAGDGAGGGGICCDES